MMPSRTCTAIVGFVLASALLAGGSARAEQSGVLWESTSEMSMDGMPMKMPAKTMKICSAKEWTRPPAGGDQNCTNTDFRKVGSKATWSVDCAGEMPMKGEGEMTFVGDDSYTGTVKFTGLEMPMTVKLSGKKIGGCDDPQ
jgi:hypothetical protein